LQTIECKYLEYFFVSTVTQLAQVMTRKKFR